MEKKQIEEVEEIEEVKEAKIEEKITFEDIQRANETINTTNIKGKDYAEVNQRIKAFRMVYPTGVIETEMASNENGVCVFRAYVGYRHNDELYKLATGTAYEKEGSTFINKTSFIENAETSAVGRALGMAGFGIDTSVASAEEVQNAIANQKGDFSDMPIIETQKQWIKAELTEEEIKKALSHFKVKKISDLNFMQAEKIREAKENKEEE